MKDIQQLIKQSSQEGTYEKVFPKTFLDAVKDKKTGLSLTDILSGFNMYFLSYTGSIESTRLQVPTCLRKTGLWITYIKYDKTIITEWYAGEDISDDAWKLNSNWRIGSNMLIGDITISSEGNWVVNGVDTEVKAQGEQGITPLLRIKDNKLQVSYTDGFSYVNINDTPIYTEFRENENKLQQSTDLGNTWTDISDYIAAWFRWAEGQDAEGHEIGKIQISRDNGESWEDLSNYFSNNLHIKDYVSTVGNLPSSAALGDIYGVGPTYASEDTGHTNPIYRLYVKTSSGWVDNGQFTSISAGITQEITDSEFTIPSNSAIRNKLCLQELGESTQFPVSQKVVTDFVNNIKIIKVGKSPTNDSIYFSDENGNVLLCIKDGHIFTKNFATQESAKKIEIIKLYNETSSIKNDIDSIKKGVATFNTIREKDGLHFIDNEGYSIMSIKKGRILTKNFDSDKVLLQTRKSNNDIIISDEFSNIVALIREGDIRTKHFDSKYIRILVDAIYNRLVNIEKDDLLLRRKEVPAISWIDDDFDTAPAKLPMLNKLHEWCINNNIRADIALTPNSITEGSGQDISINDVYFKEDKLQLIKQWEIEGFDFLVHPPHEGLYSGGGGDWNVIGSPEYIRKNITLTIQCFRKHYLNPNILVYPGGSSGTPTVVECAKKYFDCAIMAGGGAVTNYKDRYKITRIPLIISETNTVSMIKKQIDDAVTNGKWVIFMSHCWQHTGDGTEAIDETSMSFANLFHIITYANSLSKIKSTREVWKERSILWNYYN